MLGNVPKAVLRRLMARNATLSVAITAIVVAADYFFNVFLLPGLTPYTPTTTFIIVLLIAPPFVFVLSLQTEQVRRAHQQLAAEQAARAAAEAVNAARSRFLANTSHELRTPLNGVIGYSELMLETADADGRVQDCADHRKVIASARRLLALLNDLLDLAEVDANKLTLKLSEFSVCEMLEDAIDVVRPLAAANGDTIRLQIDERLAAARSDRMRLEQCVLNLLSNAAKFTQNGAIDVAARLVIREGVDWLEIEVRDSGVGIAPAQQAFLFEPFMQAHSEAYRTGALGTGLGLALTRQLARLLGGDVSVQSAAGKGSTFTLATPLRLQPPAGDATVDGSEAGLPVAA